MSYLHVLAKISTGSEAVECIFKDLTEKELRRRFLKPYQKGSKVLADAKVIDLMAMAWVQIIQTERPSQVELAEIQERSRKEIQDFNRNSSVVLISIGRGYADEDIAEAGEDVTAIYIKGPPGESPNPLMLFLNHQWIVAVVGGVVVAGIVAWLGWS